ncbi:LacI family DNA-binding transcriptional regulator [Kineococcus glutinatus]|uniref:LacI family DNA-binding transcriptional regulator n=1 Tax=Kineococcus glutinatus TaxID=1070872 RepID=A0ABP8VBP1_9ACTN
MADVARLAGVNASTVSHVVNGTRPVSDGTREAVLRAIAQTGYRHNALARSLATSSTTTLGLASSISANPHFADLVRAVESAARAAGYTLLLGDTHDDAEQELRVVQELADRRVDGVLLAPSPHAGERALPLLRAAGVPTVLVDRFTDDGLDQIAPENVEATAALAGHLADIGHTRVAMVVGMPGLHSSAERLAGYRRTVAERGLDDDPALVVAGGSEPGRAAEAVAALFARAGRPSAVVVGNNAMTIGTMRALRDLGLRVPDDVALACYDDFEWSDLFEPRLTAIAQDVPRMGARAVAMMLERIADPALPARAERVVPALRHRTSCGCRPGRAPRTTASDPGPVPVGTGGRGTLGA